MATRLMFAVATSTKPDILLVDEMFGTGDAEFQAQAKKRMEELIRSVGIFVFASHDHKRSRPIAPLFLSGTRQGSGNLAHGRRRAYNRT